MVGYIFCKQGFTSDQMRLAEENTAVIEHREKEIQSIVQSISELNEIFRDLATMIVEQVCQTFVFSCLTINKLDSLRFKVTSNISNQKTGFDHMQWSIF